jgi:hypothetical protein
MFRGSALESLSSDNIITLCAFVSVPDLGMLSSASKELRRVIDTAPAIWKHRFGALGGSIDGSDAQQRDDWRNRFLEQYMLKGDQKRCCLCYGATPNEIMADFGLRICSSCISSELVNKTKAKEDWLLGEKEIVGLPCKKKTMKLFAKDTVVSFYLTQHTNRAAIKKYGSLSDLKAKKAQKSKKKAAKVSDKQKRISLLNAALSVAGAALDVRMSSKKSQVISCLSIGANDDDAAASELWRYISTGKFNMPQKKKAKKEQKSTAEAAVKNEAMVDIAAPIAKSALAAEAFIDGGSEEVAKVESAAPPCLTTPVSRKRKSPERFVAEPSSAHNAGPIKIPALNARIDMYWPGPKQLGWHNNAQVIAFSASKGHMIRYKDQSTEWLHFDDRGLVWRLSANAVGAALKEPKKAKKTLLKELAEKIATRRGQVSGLQV